jgi:hypothetical protein
MTHRLLRTSTHLAALVLAASLLAVLAFAAVPASAGVKSCKRVTVDSGGVGGEAGAYRIKARNMPCRSARRLVRRYLLDGAPDNWALKTGVQSYLLYRGARQVRFSVQS